MKKMKIVTVVGTRPEIIRLSEVIKELDRTMEQIIVHTGQNYDYELSEVFFKELGIRKPDYFLGAAGKSANDTVGKIISAVDGVLEKEKPDAFLVLGDTNSCMAAYSAKRRKIPIFHMEAGNRSFDFRVPEEVNRRVIDHLSDMNLTYSELARHNLLREGLPADRIIKTGSPIYEALMANMKKIQSSKILKDLGIQKEKYFVLTAHREENIDIPANFARLIKIIESVSEMYKMPIIFSCHPRTRKRMEEQKIILPKTVKIMKPMGLFDFVHLEMNAFCVLSDSGTISEESSILNFPALNLREAHERPEAMDEASVIMTGLNPERILQALEMVKNQSRGIKRDFRTPKEYGYANVSKKVARIILSYTDYVKRKVWLDFSE
ncbi:MAG: UDP-N-acetylglucosamine 2-epimerase (non-hydrolyzing) [Candidatus Paceibacterota bacterium]